MARKRKNKPPKTDNNPSGENTPDKEKDIPASDNPPPDDADESDLPYEHIFAHPHVIAALQALPARERYRNRISDALEWVYVFFVAHLKENDVDRALFALFERPCDEAAQLDGKKGTTYGALSIIARDAKKSNRQVERRYQRMASRITTAHMQLLVHDLRRCAQWEHYGNIQAILDKFLPPY
jgi:hypothetical protein